VRERVSDLQDHLLLRTEATSNNVTDFGVPKAVAEVRLTPFRGRKERCEGAEPFLRTAFEVTRGDRVRRVAADASDHWRNRAGSPAADASPDSSSIIPGNLP
jgi:hypothetical protein